MRVRIKSEAFPSKDQFLSALAGSIGCKTVLDVLYNSMSLQFGIIGVSLVRYDFDECLVVIQKQYPCDWVLEIRFFNH